MVQKISKPNIFSTRLPILLIFAANESYGTQLLTNKSGASIIDFLMQKNGRAFLQSLFVQIDFSRKSSEMLPRGSGKSIFLKTQAISAQSENTVGKPLISSFQGYMDQGGSNQPL